MVVRQGSAPKESDYLIRADGYGLMRTLKGKKRSELYELIYELIDRIGEKG